MITKININKLTTGLKFKRKRMQPTDDQLLFDQLLKAYSKGIKAGLNYQQIKEAFQREFKIAFTKVGTELHFKIIKT